MNRYSNNSGDSMTIDLIESEVRLLKIRIQVNENLGFILVIKNGQFEFYGSENNGGTLSGVPITKSPPQIYEWIKNEVPKGGRKSFAEKKGLSGIAKRTREMRLQQASAE